MRTHSTEERVRRAGSFNEDAERYDRARPTYPTELFDRLWQVAGFGGTPSIVEVGCGTGQASVCLARRGAKLTCVELGENMAAIARRKLADLPFARVVVSRFEEWDPEGARFDLVFASSSWHWIQPEVRYMKAAEVLRSGGATAIVNSVHVFPEDYDPLFHAVQDVYGEVTGSKHEVKARLDLESNEFDGKDLEHIAEMERSGAFEGPKVERFLWHCERTADEFVDLLGTFSDNWALEPGKRDRLFEGIHRVIASSPTGTIRKHYVSTLRVARRK